MTVIASETWTGSNGASWPSQWIETYGEGSGSASTIQGNTGRQATAAVAFAWRRDRLNVVIPEDFEATFNVTPTVGSERYGLIHFHGHGGERNYILDNSHQLRIVAGSVELYVVSPSGVESLLTSGSFSWVSTDTLRFRLFCQGDTIRVRWWKNADPEPPSAWNIDTTDEGPTGGRFMLSCRNGNDAVADTWDWDTLSIDDLAGGGTSATVEAVMVAARAGVAQPTVSAQAAPRRSHSGYNWTDFPPTLPAAHATLTASRIPIHNVHSFGFGSGNANPSPGVFNWTQLDPFVELMTASAAPLKMITLFSAPGWMKTDSSNPADWAAADLNLDLAPTVAHFDHFATWCATIAARYPQVTHFQVWHGMRGFWLGTRWNYESYTALYNKVYNAVKSARPDAEVGGPYVELKSGTAAAMTTAGFLPTDGNAGRDLITWGTAQHVDQAAIDVYEYWKLNAVGWDFVSVAGGNHDTVGSRFTNTPSVQLNKLLETLKWVRANVETVKPLLWTEAYLHESRWTFGLTQTALEDLWFELLTKAEQQLANQTYFFHWGDGRSLGAPYNGPEFQPQPVNPIGSSNRQTTITTIWEQASSTSVVVNPQPVAATASVPSPGKSTGSTVGATTVAAVARMGLGGTGPVDLFALWQSYYPASGAEIWVDGQLGNDANSGSSVSPKRTMQGAVDAASAGSRIMVRPHAFGSGYTAFQFASSKAGTASNYIQLIAPAGAKILANGGAFESSCATQIRGRYIAFYGFEYQGINQSSNPFETGINVIDGGRDVAVWNCDFHDLASHAVCLPGDSGQGFAGCDKIDFCYNRVTRCSRWNPFQASGFSTISMANLGTAWSDGYRNRIVGNVIDNCFTETSQGHPFWGITDGNAIIMDYSGGYTGRTLIAHNVAVGCGGRGMHDLGVDNVDIWLNTACDNSQNLAGSWIGELSITGDTTTANNSSCRFNVAAARVGSNRVGIFENATTRANSVWSDNVFLRGTGSGGGDPSVSENNNINKTAVGPAGYFTNYQQGVFTQTVITDVAGFRPVAAHSAQFNPTPAMRATMAPWPDATRAYRPAGAWSYGAIDITPGGGGFTVSTNLPPVFNMAVPATTVRAVAIAQNPNVTTPGSSTLVLPVRVAARASVPTVQVVAVDPAAPTVVTPATVGAAAAVDAPGVVTPGFAVVQATTVAARVTQEAPAVVVPAPLSGDATVTPATVAAVAGGLEVAAKGRRSAVTTRSSPRFRRWWNQPGANLWP